MTEELSLYCKGLKWKGRKLFKDLGMEVMEGKNPTTLQFYKYLAKEFFESDKKEHIFLVYF